MGRDIYIREGCVGCHSQQVRLLAAEVQRYGSYSLASESVFDHPFLWGSKRTGPDLARLGERYSDEWHRIHLRNPRMVVPESNMPAYPWLEKTSITGQNVQDRMRALRLVGVPYSDEEIAAAPKAIEGKTEEDALVAYLQGLGVGVRKAQQAKKAAAAEKPPRRPSTPPGSRPPSRPREADHGLHQRNRHRHLDGNLFGIVWWACSRGRQSANSESAMLPFALPDEFGPAQQDGANRS